MSETDTAATDAGTANQDTAGGGTGAQDTQNATNGSGSQDGGSGGTTTGTSAGADGGSSTGDGEDKTARTIAAIRDDFKAERARRQATEKALADFKADSERKEQERQAAEADRNKKLAIALGVASEDEPPDPAKLAEELQRTQEQHKAELAARDAAVRQRDIRLAVLTQAPALEANGALLMDSLSFLEKVSGLDPAAEDFSERLTIAIKAAADANPNYKLAKPAANGGNGAANGQPSRSGGEHTAPGGNRQWTVADVEAASPSEVTAAGEQGLLVDLGYHPKKHRR